jgi:hypothetical protein
MRNDSRSSSRKSDNQPNQQPYSSVNQPQLQQRRQNQSQLNVDIQNQKNSSDPWTEFKLNYNLILDCFK